MDSGPPDHQLNTCFNDDSSDGRRPRFNHVFYDSPSNTWLRKEAPIKIGRAKKRENVGPRCEIVAHLKHAIVPSNRSSSDQTVRNFCGDFSYKYLCSSFVKQLLIES